MTQQERYESKIIEIAHSCCDKSGSCSVSEILDSMKCPEYLRPSLDVSIGKLLKRSGWIRFRPRRNGRQGVRYSNPSVNGDRPVTLNEFLISICEGTPTGHGEPPTGSADTEKTVLAITHPQVYCEF
jgi:hypothetical protein